MNRALISKALMALEHADSWTDDLTVHYEVAEAIEALRQELEKPEPEPIAYLAWRDGKPCWDGDDCVWQGMTIKQTADNAATVSTHLQWIPIAIAEPPIGSKVLVIDEKQRIAYLRDYMPRQGWTHWFPLPTFRGKT